MTAAVIGLVLAVGPAGAQGGRAERRDEAAKMVDAYILSNLQERLNLSDTQFVKLLPLVKGHQAERRRVAQRRLHALMELRRTLASGQATEASIGALLDEAKKAEVEGPAAVARSQGAIDALLTPVQQAKFRVFEAEVEQRLRDMLRGARGRALERRDRRRGDAPADEPDEP
jgi:Spy/CpxP family protein refolding chaperone